MNKAKKWKKELSQTKQVKSSKNKKNKLTQVKQKKISKNTWTASEPVQAGSKMLNTEVTDFMEIVIWEISEPTDVSDSQIYFEFCNGPITTLCSGGQRVLHWDVWPSHGKLSFSPARCNNLFRQLSGSDPMGKASRGAALNQLGGVKMGSTQGQLEASFLWFFVSSQHRLFSTFFRGQSLLIPRMIRVFAHVHRLYAPRSTAVHGANQFRKGTNWPVGEGGSFGSDAYQALTGLFREGASAGFAQVGTPTDSCAIT